MEGYWVVIKSSPLSRSHLLRALLERQFPKIHFHYLRFNKLHFGPGKKIDLKLRSNAHGVIAELKQLQKTGLSYFDRLVKQFVHQPIIFILSPESFSLLSATRKKILFQHMMVISELKSLDYLTQLPRLMDEVSLRSRLKQENERLRELIASEKSIDESLDFVLSEENPHSTQKGLKITLKDWNRFKSKVGQHAQSEVIEAFSRMISRAVRSSDRILHSRENEFLVFLSNIDRVQQARCMQRVKEKLSSIEIAANTRHLDIGFSVNSIEHLPFTS